MREHLLHVFGNPLGKPPRVLRAGARVVAEVPEHARRARGARAPHAAHGHAEVLRLDHHRDAVRRRHRLDGLRDLK